MSHLRAFASEVAQAAGIHAITSVSLRQDVLEHRHIADHEGIHDELIHETPDGELLRWLAHAAASEDPEERLSGQAWQDQVMSSMTCVQESAATYLSIKRLPPATHEVVLRQHPDEYRGYYDRLASAVDPCFASTYLQWIVARAIADISLSSHAAAHFPGWPTTPPGRLPPEYRGDERFTAVLAVFRGIAGELAEIAGACARAAGFANDGPSLDREEFWESLDHDARRSLERLLRRELHAHLATRARAAIPVLSQELWPGVLSRLEVAVAARYPVMMRAPALDMPLLAPLGKVMGLARYRRVLRAASVRIVSPPRPDRPQLPSLPGASALAVLGAVDLIQDEDSDADWTVAARRPEGAALVARLHADCDELAAAALPAESVVLLNVAVPTNTTLANERALRALLGRGVRVCCYLRGSLLAWLEWLSAEPGARLSLKFFAGADDLTDLWGRIPLTAIHGLSAVTLHVLTSPRLPGVGLRLTATTGTEFLLEAEVALGELALLSERCDDQDQELAAEVVRLAQIWNIW